MKNFEKRKQDWLEEVCKDCHEFALKSNLDFYVFQTPIIYNPKLLIIGINPGGGKTYSEILKEKNINKRTPETLYYGENTLTNKPIWEIEANLKGSDVLRDRIKRIFNDENNLNILENSMMMNMFYFNTKKGKDIEGINLEIKQYCIEKTKEFIEIINPKNILFLTSSNNNLKECSVKEIKIIGDNVKTGKLGNREVVAIPHYGFFSAYSHENSKKIGKKLSEIFK
ncbi:hypothetical protein JSO62_10465 [Riemerella anatipestifer]|uniref:hypothetical protein n=1 Tax=Riemerella anatipestifer TaxID=34085 RepID=UPI002A8E70C8|nr:hypothetical protein [Riemerella anatipestifer]MDY3536265.1 hypothetical protein [Riemerella anatipestifer]